SSPLKRCKKLALAIAGSNVIYDDRLMELNFGDWELKEWNKINNHDLDVWMNDFVFVACPGGESYHQMFQRVKDFMEELKSISNKSKALVITHAGVIRAIDSYLNDTDLKDSFNLKVNYGQVLQYKF